MPLVLKKAFAKITDPATAHAAAKSVGAHVTFMEDVVLKALTKAGTKGLTIDEIVVVSGLDKVTASPRMRPLVKKGLVKASGKRPGPSGRGQTVWVVK